MAIRDARARRLAAAGAVGLLLAWAGAAQAAPTRANRAADTLFLGINPVGGQISTLFAPSATLAVYAGERWMLGVEYGAYRSSGTYRFESIGDDTTFINLENKPGIRDPLHTNAGAFMRWFPGNSFFFHLGFNLRTWDGTAEVTLQDGTLFGKQVDADISTRASVASLGLGNLWILDNGFTLGAMWGVASTLIGSSYKFTVAPNQGLTAQEVTASQKALKDFAQRLNEASASSGFALLYLGYSF